jgi:Ni,Fe-hydrogenase III large subunit/Ni,Fe-hydrogenase III component G
MIDLVNFCAQLSAACSDDSLKAVRLLPHEIAVYLSPQSLPQAVQTLRNEFGAIFVDLFGVDQRSFHKVIQLHLIFAIDAEHTWVHLNADLDDEHRSFPSLMDELPATGWYEREVWEELGLTPQGHPILRRLRLSPDWPEDVHPDQQTFNWGQQVGAVQPRYFELEPAPVGVVDYPLGPVRSGIVESGHYTLRTVGEEIVDMYLQLFYKHRGVEKRAEGLPIELLPLVAERISGTSAFAHSLALCQALENLVEVEIPPRARYLRTLLAELERLYNHLGYQADLCQATGLSVAQAQFDIVKERVLRLNAAIGGHRYLFGMNIPGGLSRDLTEQQQKAVHDLMVALRRDLETLQRLLSSSPSHRDRLENTGILAPQEAQAYCAVGPIGRASGIDRDLRRDHPYAAYADIDFDIPLLQDGDAMARAHIRLEETMQSLRIIDQVLDRLPWGPVHAPVRQLPPGESASGWVESARGECMHWLLVGEDGTLQHYRVRPASFANWQAFSIAIPGHNILTDFPVIEQSFGLSFAGADR